jgi:hypothetical protein
VADLSRADFLMACGPAKNAAADVIERTSLDLARQAGLLRDDDAKRFAAFNRIVPYVYPTAEPARAIACAQWCNWLFFFDDVHDEDYDQCDDLDRVADTMEHHLALLRTGRARGRPDPLSNLTLDFRARALDLAGAAWLDRFSASAEDYLFRGVLPAVQHWIGGQTPSLREYLEQREFDSAVHTAIDLIELAEGVVLPEATVASEPAQRMRQACARAVAYFNDIVSYPKEVLQNRNPNNLIHVLMKERGASFADATAEAVQLVNASTRALLDHDEALRSHPAASPDLARVALGMRQWQRGNVEWSLAEARYASAHSSFAELQPALASAVA